SRAPKRSCASHLRRARPSARLPAAETGHPPVARPCARRIYWSSLDDALARHVHASGSGGASAHAQPHLGAPEKRDPDVAAHFQLGAALEQRERAAVDPTFVGIEDLALATLPAQDLHADDRLALELARA